MRPAGGLLQTPDSLHVDENNRYEHGVHAHRLAWLPRLSIRHTSMERLLNYNRSPALTQLTANALGWGANQIADGCPFRIDQRGLVDCALGSMVP